MHVCTLFVALLLLLPPLARADEPSPAPEPPAGSIKLKGTEPAPAPVELEDQGPVTGKVQKPSVDVLILSDPVTPEIEPPTRRAR